MKSIINLMIMVAIIFLFGAVYETIRNLYHMENLANPIGIMVYYIMSAFWMGAAIFLKRKKTN